MKNIGYVYKIVNPKGKIYIGSTKNFAKRMNHYKTMLCKNQIKLYNSLLKYGFEKHIVFIIWEGPQEDMFKKEHELGIYYNVLSKDLGLNLVLPKGNEGIRVYSEETIEKMKKGQAKRAKRNPCSDKTKLKISIANKGKKPSVLSRINNAIAHSKKVYCTQTEKEYNSITEAAKSLNVPLIVLSEMLRGKKKNNTTLLFM